MEGIQIQDIRVVGLTVTSEQSQAVDWLLQSLREDPTTLSLSAAYMNWETVEWVPTPHRQHVVQLWEMDKALRLQVWSLVAQHLHQVETVHLAGTDEYWKEVFCPMDVQDMQALFPKDSLKGVQDLLLQCFCGISDDAIRHLTEVAGCGGNITSLRLFGLKGDLTDNAFQYFSASGCGPKLTSLSLRCLFGITDLALQYLASGGCGPQLTDLVLHALPELTDEGIHKLTAAGCGSQLTSLTLHTLEAGITDKSLERLAAAGCGPDLRSLSLYILKKGVTDRGLECLCSAGCGPRLQLLWLGGATETRIHL